MSTRFLEIISALSEMKLALASVEEAVANLITEKNFQPADTNALWLPKRIARLSEGKVFMAIIPTSSRHEASSICRRRGYYWPFLAVYEEGTLRKYNSEDTCVEALNNDVTHLAELSQFSPEQIGIVLRLMHNTEFVDSIDWSTHDFSVLESIGHP